MAKSFGVTGSWAAGVIQELTQGSSVEKAQARSQVGKVTDEQYYSKTSTSTANIVVDGTFDGFEAGESITLPGLTAICQSAERTDSATDYARGTVTIEKPDSATQVAYS